MKKVARFLHTKTKKLQKNHKIYKKIIKIYKKLQKYS